MEPPCLSTYHIPDDVYLPEQSTNMGFLNNRIPPLVVTENHNSMCSNNSLKSFPQPSSFIWVHTRRYVSGLDGAYVNWLLLPGHPLYRSRIQRETTLKSAPVILHTTYLISIRIMMQFHISNNVSQSMRDWLARHLAWV